MALPRWMHIAMSVVYEVAAFLIEDPSALASLGATPCYDSLTSPRGEPLRLSDYLLSYLSSLAGLELPRAITILNGLPLATSLLLRLTEVIPPELILFLCVSGVVLWLIVFGLGALLVVLVIGVLCSGMSFPTRLFRQRRIQSVGSTTQEALPPPEVTPPALEAHPSPPAPLSSTVQAFIQDVNAHNPDSPPNSARRKRTKKTTRP